MVVIAAPCFAAPTSSSKVGDTVTNPVTGGSTKVTALVVDPTGTPTAGDTAFVQTEDGYTFLVKTAGQIVYNNDSPADGFTIGSISGSLVRFTGATLDGNSYLYSGITTSEYNSNFLGNDEPGYYAPSDDSSLNETVYNPVTNNFTTVSSLVVDPASTPTAGDTAFVETSNGYVFLVKSAGETIYNEDNPPVAYTISSISGTTAQLSTSGATGTAPLSTQLTLSNYNSNFVGQDTPGELTPPVDVVGATGVSQIVYGRDGSNGRDGALFVPPKSGGDGDNGPTQIKTLSSDVNASSNAGWIVGSIGGDGGNGGDSYASFFSGKSGGDAGNGGTVNATQSSSSSIQTSGNGSGGQGNDGIFAFSRSGKAGNGGSGYAAPSGGSGGDAGQGGSVTVNQYGEIFTTGDASDGIYALSMSDTAGGGGSQWGLFGGSGSGGGGGNGGNVTVNTYAGAQIITQGDFANGIYAQSIGGSGGSSGTSGNLIVSVSGSSDNGGDGGKVTISHAGAIQTGSATDSTKGMYARGILAQSVGGGGGSGGVVGGLISIAGGGMGADGGDGDEVSVTVQGSGSIVTFGYGADGIMAQSIGGSGGFGTDAYGLVAVGGDGANGGNGNDVSVTNKGSIVTHGTGARGIIAQSIGGGGGDGGSTGGMVSVGGSGDGGGDGADITIVNDGIITTSGDEAMGILAQSIGGGGGNGGSSVAVGVFAGVAIGGDGGAGGKGGTASVSLSNTDASQPSAVQTSGDRSTGVFVQSVGGGGGNGGGAVAVSAGFGASASVSVGGEAGSGGDGGIATLAGSGSASVQTGGDDAAGVILQSIGGGGGNGGYAVSVAVSGGPVSGSLAVGVGGSGGSGGKGGTVTVGTVNGSGVLTASGFDGQVVTTGERSTGMLFQSVGGGGGNGGLAVAATGGASALMSGNVSIGVGGSGGSGGNGGIVRVYNKANVTTTQSSSTAMIAQSIGGGGGNGGGSVAAGISASGGAAIGVNVGAGGTAGSAGIGGAVTLIAGGDTILTQGDFSSGILAQSVGGGGGNGGYAVGASADIAGGGAASISVGVGGGAGGGGAGGNVTAQIDADVTTRGNDASAVVVQSIGGGGGNGGFSVAAGLAAGGGGAGTIGVGLGGSGGSGGFGGTVSGVRINGDVSTEGERSTAVLVQSIGGGGGNGGFNVTAGVAAGGAGAGAIGVGLGGSGSTGGDGGVVEAQVAGNVSTLKESSSGVVFQSIGGGGGNGGFNVTGGVAGAGAGGGAVTVGLGGDAGGGGVGKSVTGQVTGTVATGGSDSTAILAQSVGGGGGNGGFNISASIAGAGVGSGAVSVGLGGDGGVGAIGGTVNLTSTNSVQTTGDRSSGVVAQSIGGGGGNGGFNVSGTGAGAGVGSGAVSVGLGGTGEGGGNGGNVTLTSNGTILTTGESSTAFLAQSVGGGGGNGGFNVSAAVQGSGTAGAGISVGLGGDGGGGGNGLTVNGTSTKAVETRGNNSSGVVAQSIGGGGGNGGFNISAALSGAGTASGAIGVGLGGNGDGGGTGGTVTLTSNGTILTQGDNSTAFLAQSVGGGGGNGGFNVSGTISGAGTGSAGISVGLGGDGGTGSEGGIVTGNSTAAVETRGDSSSGVVAQSIGGGGGNGGFNVAPAISAAGTGSGALSVGLGGSGAGGGDGKDVELTSNGTILTNGFASSGFVAQSIGGGGGNGGFNVAPTISGAGTGAGSLSVGLGGSGEGGGNGGKITAKTTDTVTTQGDASVGILAQSVGGGGGNGGFNVSPALAGAGTGAGAISVGLGGSGGGGGDGGIVGLTVENDVRTEGDQSSAIVAQSVGGGGGNGGFNVSASVGGAGTGAGGAAVGLGGSGDGGGNADAVTANVTGNIVTLGETSSGLLVQSVGGGGGNGGMNISVAVAAAGKGAGGASVGLGGAGGTGGSASTATGTLTGNVGTMGDNSGGVVVQSLGGGGGNGGMNISATVTVSGKASGGASVGIGGSGGNGGGADAANGTVVGDVVTMGANSGGVLVQSAGGGGGNGGMNISAAVNLSGTGGGAVGVGIGGSGGDGGNAKGATGHVTGDVTTSGKDSTAVMVQSVGGGGGNGGLNISGAISIAREGSGAAGIGVGGFGGSGGTSGVVSNTFIGTATTLEDRSAGVIAQSLGGGGGNGATNISGAISLSNKFSGALGIGVGGFGGDGGKADSVTQVVTGNVSTMGDDSTGILTQSLGGGGGNGGTNISAALSISRTTSGAIGIGVGGFGGGGANAGDLVQSTVTGGVTTSGNRSTGVLTQSIGGGGGNGGTNVSATMALSQENGGAVSLGVGGFGGGAGDGKTVTSTLRAGTDTSIVTRGKDSIGVMAQSVGGGGGTGGLNVSGAVSITGKSGAAVGLGLGGFGGGGGDAGMVTLDVESDIYTAGDGGHALFAQSLGGGGGTGGANISGTLSLTKPSGSDTIFSVAGGVGGFGGDGGGAQAVDLDYTGNIQALPMVEQSDGSFAVDQNKGASGIIAQSIGGGGGTGGLNVSGALAISGKPGAGLADDSKSYAVAIGVGGFGGGGGNAGNVDVDVGAGSTIRAHGTGQSGILAQSVGGGGGNGGMNVSGGIVSDSSLIVGVGGFAGDGGTAGDVTVTTQADITVSTNPDDISIPDTTTFEDKLRDFLGDTIVDETEELASTYGLERLFIDMGVFNEEKPDTDGSAGLMAQSIGGGGGNGGLNVSGGIALSKDGKIPSVTFGVGGFGGNGNISGDVTVDHSGTVTVAGNWKHGVLAQSIAGGGGNGALNVTGQLNYGDSNNSDGKTDLSIVGGLGGHGGTGAHAGNVSVTQTGDIATNGYHARGIFAQSIGGGGGTGGINATFVGTKDSSPIAMGIGGFGGGGGDAGDVTVARGTSGTAAGTIQTDGVGSHGIEASSIGGGGGDAGINAVVGISKTTGSQSNGGTGDSTDRKTPTNSGVDDSVIANYNNVLDELEGKTNPADSSGKKTGMSAVIAIGGDAGTAGDGGEIDVDHYGDIVTLQDSSHGIFGQSIGGGGGNAALNIGLAYELSSDQENKGFGLAIGGGTGEGGIGGSVDVRHTGDITTSGADSYGVFAQSVGGGGGNAGYNSSSTSVDGGNINIQIGRTGGTGGKGGDVYASSDGEIRTSGKGSYGFFAQSIGNGGGNSSSTSVSIGTPKTGDSKGNKASLSVGLEGGTGGEAGDVTANVAGLVVTQGTDAHGVFAQAIGGGGGNGGKASNSAGGGTSVALSIGGTGGTGGLGGKVDVTNTAQIATFGDRSIGLVAQSIGGAGGTGGMVQAGQGNLDTIKQVVSPSTIGTVMSVNIGGTGGDGMTSDTVTVDSDGPISTAGMLSHGIFAQSVGGGGGMGGVVENRIISLRKEIGNTATLSIGGNGGTGATSAAVLVTNRDQIQTTGEKSAGIYAQSVGGGGGDAQQVRNIILGRSSDGSTTNAILIGGTGGTGGAGSTVEVVNTSDATIQTTGKDSYGIFAQSIGGGGGNGGSTISVDGRYGGAEASTRRAIQFGLGGSGGSGGTGNTANVTNDGTIITTGEKAHAILAQSIGGGGGNGGMSITGTVRLKTGDNSSPTAQLNIGGSGGDGNAAGNVDVTNSGDIQVDGDAAYGIYAQSVGGGGGNGGLAVSIDVNDLKNTMTGKSYSKIAIGGAGGDGANGGDVDVTHSGTIVVNGDNAYGIYAQSVGGGGGNAGYSISSPLVSAADFVISQVMGAREGSTGTSGTVTVNTTGDIFVNGAGSEAVFAQSVNGGGGNVDTFVDFKAPVSTTPVVASLSTTASAVTSAATGTGTVISSDVSLGGTDVSGMAGNDVDQSHSGNIVTAQGQSTGMMLQSVGGGGGMATTTISVDEGEGIDLTARLGAIDTDNAGGGNVTGERTGDVTTAGAFSSAGSAQSIGGGGGKLVLQNASEGAADETQSASVILGADPSFTNNGGDVTLTLDGDVSTTGDNAFGQVVQSIGAGGGEAVIAGLGAASVTLGAQDNSTGDGGAIIMSNAGGMTTNGAGSHGFVLQSIGGGGGLVTTDMAAEKLTLTLSDANGGDGGAIDFTQTGNVVTNGDNAIGVLAQSLGGGGGAVDAMFRGSAGGAGSGGPIDLDLEGNMLSVGNGGIAVLAQSEGRDGADAITLGFDGVVMGGTGEMSEVASVIVDGGTDNALTFSSDSLLMAANTQLVLGSTGNENIALAGQAFGNLNLGGGINELDVEQGGTFYTQDIIDLGASGMMQVDGNLILGATAGMTAPLSGDVKASDFTFAGNVSQTTALNGSIAFGETAQSTFDVYFLTSGAAGGDSDLINATGNATMGGTMTPVLNTLERALPLVLINAEGTVADNGTEIQDTVVLDYSIALEGAQTPAASAPALAAFSSASALSAAAASGGAVTLVVNPDFSTQNMNRNQAAVGDYINRVLTGQGSAEQGQLFALIGNMTSEADVIAAIDSFTIGDYAADVIDNYYGALRFADAMHGCQDLTPQSEGWDPRRCFWLALSGSRFDRSETALDNDLSINGSSLSGGLSYPIGEDLYAGFALGYDQSSLTNGPLFNSSGERLNFGVSVTKYSGPWEIAGSWSGGRTRYDTERGGGFVGALPGGAVVDTTAVSNISHKTRHQNIRLSFAYDHQIEGSQSYVKPTLAFDTTMLKTRANGQALSSGIVLQDHEQMIFSFTPSVEVGTQRRMNATYDFRASMRAGAMLSSSDTISVAAGFSGASALDGGFENVSYIDDTLGLVSLDLGLYEPDESGFIELGVDGMFGELSDSLQFRFGFGLQF
ncbi:beta strand repeat-containing protein [Roseovarius albus]|uniref:beta strand repeat-containing protein n=1 Tax=Roseovarius albus TaxID=1247867 RepID=UPI00117B7F94|nr:hypothetical protein [Roseovarius albus]